jgi:hypothetical protein
MLIGFNSQDHFNLSTRFAASYCSGKNSPSREANFRYKVMARVDHEANNDAVRSRPRLIAVAMSDLGAERQQQSLRLKMGIHQGLMPRGHPESPAGTIKANECASSSLPVLGSFLLCEEPPSESPSSLSAAGRSGSLPKTEHLMQPIVQKPPEVIQLKRRRSILHSGQNCSDGDGIMSDLGRMPGSAVMLAW